MAKGVGVPDEMLGEILWMYLFHDDKTVRATAKLTFMKIASNDVKQVVKENWKEKYRTPQLLKSLELIYQYDPDAIKRSLIQAAYSQKELEKFVWRLIASEGLTPNQLAMIVGEEQVWDILLNILNEDFSPYTPFYYQNEIIKNIQKELNLRFYSLRHKNFQGIDVAEKIWEWDLYSEHLFEGRYLPISSTSTNIHLLRLIPILIKVLERTHYSKHKYDRSKYHKIITDAVTVLGFIGDKTILPHVIKVIENNPLDDSKDEAERQMNGWLLVSCIKTLDVIGDESIIPHVTKLIDNTPFVYNERQEDYATKCVLQMCIKTLEVMEDKSVIPTLLEIKKRPMNKAKNFQKGYNKQYRSIRNLVSKVLKKLELDEVTVE